MIENENLLENANRISELFRQRLTELQAESELVKEVRILGLMIGIELSVDGTPVVQGCMDQKLLVNCTQNTVIRLLPAMNLTEQQVHDGCDILAKVIHQQTG